MNNYGVILAGGGGTRFWPASRQKLPKQLLNLSGKELMVNETIDRFDGVIPSDSVYVVTNRVQADLMLDKTAGRLSSENIFIEPSARNTAACIGYAAIQLMKKYGDGVMVICPSDAYIRNAARYREIIRQAIAEAESGKLVTIGIEPTFPSTGYGYIHYGDAVSDYAHSVEEFREKPNLEVAISYLNAGDYVWNSGIFVWKASTILEKFAKYEPEISEKLREYGAYINTEDEEKMLQEIYPTIKKISIDYAIMEPASHENEVVVIPGDFGWSDVGSWEALDALHEKDENGNIQIGDTLVIDTENSTVYAGSRFVAVMGVSDVVVAETEDAVLVCGMDHVQDVRKIVDELTAGERKELL